MWPYIADIFGAMLIRLDQHFYIRDLWDVHSVHRHSDKTSIIYLRSHFFAAELEEKERIRYNDRKSNCIFKPFQLEVHFLIDADDLFLFISRVNKLLITCEFTSTFTLVECLAEKNRMSAAMALHPFMALNWFCCSLEVNMNTFYFFRCETHTQCQCHLINLTIHFIFSTLLNVRCIIKCSYPFWKLEADTKYHKMI